MYRHLKTHDKVCLKKVVEYFLLEFSKLKGVMKLKKIRAK